MSLVHTGGGLAGRPILAVFLFALPISLATADQSVLLIPDSNLPQRKDFLKEFSTKDFLKEPAPPPLGKEGPQRFFVNPQTPGAEKPSVVIVEKNTPRCSIPLLEKHAAQNLDPKGAIKVTPGSSDSIAGRNPAPACKNWGEKRR